MVWYQHCDVRNGLTDAICRLLVGGWAYRCHLEIVGSCLERNRFLGASVVRYSTGELTLEVNCISCQCIGYIATYWGKVKPTVFDQVQVL